MMMKVTTSDLAWCFTRWFMITSLLGVSCDAFDTRPVNEHVCMTFETSTDKSKRPVREFIIDSGASIHCVNDERLLQTIYKNHPTVKITVAMVTR